MTGHAKTHGMDGTLVAPDWPALTLEELRTLLQNFPDLGSPEAIETESPRPFSSAGIVRTAKGRVFIKRHHRSVRDIEGLKEEHRFLAHLHARGASVPRIFKTAQGESAVEIGNWTYEAHEVPEGVDLYQDAISWTPFQTVHHAHSAGHALARLHRASEGFAAPRRRPRSLVAGFSVFAADDPGPELERYLAARPALANHVAVHRNARRALDILAPFHAELRPLLPKLPPLWTHNDLHASNLLWSHHGPDARATAVIDFGLSARTCAVHDLAHAIERNMVEWLSLAEDAERPAAVHLDHLDALLSGYELVRPLSRHEAAALAPMTALCHAEFALSEADYFLGVLRSEDKARMAYDDYLVGHAEWFHSSAGKELLDALRTWAANHTEWQH
jgi:Ser/Thr protein kinase RdoA (MazF antagonist)